MQKIYQELQKGAFYVFIAKYSNVLFQLIVTSVLARLISAETFGVIAISMVFILFFYQLTDVGLGTAIVQKKNLSQLDLNTYFLLSITQGFLLTVGFVLFIPLIADFYEIEQLKNVLVLLSLSICFFSLNIVPTALLRKNKSFKKIGVVTVVTNIMTGITAIVIAIFSAHKIYALVVKVILDALFLFLISFKLSRYRPKLEFSMDSVKAIFSYSIYQFLYNLSHYLSRNIDNMFIAKYLGSAPLGYYDKAYRLMIMPVQNLSNVISPVMHPVLSSLQDDSASILKVYRNVVKLLSLVGFPLSVFLYFAAEEIILILFGEGWRESITPFKYLSLSIGFQMVISSTRSIFQAANQTRLLFFYSITSIVFLVFLLFWGFVNSYSLNGISLLILINYFLSFVLVFYLLLIKVLKTNAMKFLTVFHSPVIISITIFTIFCIFNIQFDYIFLNLVVKATLFLIVYLGVSYFLGENFLLDSLRKIISNFKNR